MTNRTNRPGPLDEQMAAALGKIRERGQFRSLNPARLLPEGRIERAGKVMVDFSSNDYLGLARHPLLIERAREWTERFGTGSGASRLVTGTTDEHLALEDRVARFKGKEAALVFASGWQANAAVIPALVAAVPGAVVFTDRLVHASIHQGCAAAGVRQVRFRHNDLAHLDQLLTERGAGAPARIILTESVFSMDGDRADVAGLVQVACRHDAFLFVDEAHATGVLGKNGAGLCADVPGVDLVMGTFSKALGGFGAYVTGSKLLCEYLVNTCSGFIFTTAPPPAVFGAIDAALDLVPSMDARRAHLASLGEVLRNGLAQLGIDTGGSTTQVVPAIVGEEEKSIELSALLSEQGLLAAAIRPPTVPPGSSRLRLALRATHGLEDVERLLEVLAKRV